MGLSSKIGLWGGEVNFSFVVSQASPRSCFAVAVMRFGVGVTPASRGKPSH